MLSAGVRDLNLGQNRLGDVGVAQLADQPAAAGLQVLRLDANGLTDAGLEALGPVPVSDPADDARRVVEPDR